MTLNPQIETINSILEEAGRLQREGKIDEALDKFACAAEIDSSLAPPEVLLTLAQFRAQRGSLLSARTLFERALTANPQSAELHTQFGKFLMSIGQVAQGIRAYQRAILVSPELSGGTNTTHVGLSLSARISNIEVELAEMVKALDSCKRPVTSQFNISEENLLRANTLAKQGWLDEAITAYRSIIEIYPEFAEAHFYLGCVLTSLSLITPDGNYSAAALEEFEIALRLKVDWAEAYYRLGRLIRYAHGNFEASLKCFETALSLKPDYEDALCGAGEACTRLKGMDSEAKEYFTSYVKLKEIRQAAHPIGKLGIRFIDWTTTCAMGHFSEIPEHLLKQQKLGWAPNHKLVIAAPPHMIANSALLEKWKEYYEVITDSDDLRSLGSLVSELAIETAYVRMPNGLVRHFISGKSYIQAEWEKQLRPPILALSPKEIERGRRALDEVGIPKDAWFVPVHVRDPAFKADSSSFYAHRNANIKTYEAAFRAITSRGGYVIRMGEPSMPALSPADKVFDYAHSPLKSPWMDIFLFGHGRFSIVTTGGAYAAPMTFDIPTIFTNWFPTSPLLYGKKALYIYKLLKKRGDDRYLKLREIFVPPYFYSEENRYLTNAGIDFADNTPEEIEEVVIEMLDRLDGTLIYSEEDELLQKKFSDTIPKDFGVLTARMGQKFLKRHSFLVE